jgi:hypothetical protein
VRRKAPLSVFVVLASFLLGCQPYSLVDLTGNELNRLIPDTRFRYDGPVNGTQYSGEMKFHQNGNLFVETDSGVPDGGVWNIQDDELCIRLIALNQGDEMCFSIRKANLSWSDYMTNTGITLERIWNDT